MSEHFSQLTPSEIERLALLSEEMAEVQKVIGKILRHGFESRNPFHVAGGTNRENLAEEMGHVAAAIEIAMRDVDPIRFSISKEQKSLKVWRWLHHNTPSGAKS